MRAPGASPVKVVRLSVRAAIRPAAKVPRPSQSIVDGLAPVTSVPALTWPAPNCAFAPSTPVPSTATRTPVPVVSGQTAAGFNRRCAHGTPWLYTPLGRAHPAAGAPYTPGGAVPAAARPATAAAHHAL